MNRLTAISLVLGPLAFGACSQPRASETKPEASAAPTVAVTKPTRGDIAHVLNLTAEFRPFQEIEVHAKVAGFLKSINVDVGDRVRAGELIAELEVPEMRDEERQDEASVSRATEEVNRAQADLERAESVHEVAHLGAARLQAVQKTRPNLVAQQDIDEGLGRDRVAEAQVATAKAALASARQQLGLARATQGKTRTLSAYTRITAPFAGVITRRYADTGAMIQSGIASQSQAMPVVRLSANDVLRLSIPVPESAASHVRVGAPVSVTVTSLGRAFPGRVARFAAKLDEQTRTMHAEVDVQNPKLELVPGMYASVSLTLEAQRDALTVPVQAVERAGEKASVMVVDKARTIQVRPVTLGIDTPDRVQVVSGLDDNDLVVVGNRTRLKPGLPVVPKVEAVAAGEK